MTIEAWKYIFSYTSLSCQSNWTFWISYFPRHLTKHFWLLHFDVELWKMSRFRIFPIEKMSHQHHFKTSYLNWMKLNWLKFSFLDCLHISAVTITWIGIIQIIFRVGLKKASIFDREISSRGPTFGFVGKKMEMKFM